VLPDGTHRWLAGQSQFVYDEAGQPLRMIGVNVDIAERRRIAEERERLLETERQARAEAERVNRLKTSSWPPSPTSCARRSTRSSAGCRSSRKRRGASRSSNRG
jgi:hypothetical protein